MENDNKVVVFATNDSGYKFDSAEGAVGEPIEIKPVTVGRVSVFHTDTLMRQIKFQLKDFRPEIDYLLISGNSIVAGLASAVLGASHHFPIKILIWDHMNTKYVARNIS